MMSVYDDVGDAAAKRHSDDRMTSATGAGERSEHKFTFWLKFLDKLKTRKITAVSDESINKRYHLHRLEHLDNNSW